MDENEDDDVRSLPSRVSRYGDTGGEDAFLAFDEEYEPDLDEDT
jgi:hypothetical protein